MVVLAFGRFIGRPEHHDRKRHTLYAFERKLAIMTESSSMPKSKSQPDLLDESLVMEHSGIPTLNSAHDAEALLVPQLLDTQSPSTLKPLSRSSSFATSSSFQEDWEPFPPL